MVNLLSLRFEQCFSPFTMLLVEGSYFLDIYLTTSFGVPTFTYTSDIRVIFCLKMFKIESNFRKCKKKNSENIFHFWYNGIWKCCNKLPLLRTEYLCSARNGLTNSFRILHITQRDFFNLNCLPMDQ